MCVFTGYPTFCCSNNKHMATAKPGDKRVMQVVLLGTNASTENVTTTMTHGLMGQRVKISVLNFTWRPAGGATPSQGAGRLDLGFDEFEPQNSGIITAMNGNSSFMNGGVQLYQSPACLYLMLGTLPISYSFSPIYWIGSLRAPTLTFRVQDMMAQPSNRSGTTGTYYSSGFGICFLTLELEVLEPSLF
jgi:hypothetical protein